MSKKNMSDAEDTSYSFNPQSTLPSTQVKIYRTLQDGYVVDFRDRDKMPTKHMSFTTNEMELLITTVISNMNYTEILAIIERAEAHE